MQWYVIAALFGGIFAFVLIVASAVRYFRQRGGWHQPAAQDPQAVPAEAFTVSPSFVGKVAAAYLAILTAIAGAGMLGYQVVAWFDSGHWPPLSLADTIRKMIGAGTQVPAALDWVPMGAVLLGGALACLVVVFRDNG